jgi:two-component system autoinducer 1 sensor kinase/phosphatase LuxN
MIPLAARTSFYIILEGMNHDIRNIMLRMKQMTLNIKDDSDRLTQKVRDKVEKRILDLDNGMSLISTLLSIFNFNKFKTENINTDGIIEELTRYFINRADYNVKFNLDELNLKDELLLCYKAEFSMIFYNLFNNSIFAIKEKGDEEGVIKVSSFVKGNRFNYIVEDNGIGINNSDIDKIFEAGFTKKEKGLGIGLFFVKQCLAESFNGEISCESIYGYFTKFIIKIPRK